jgi:hypothetical protein
MVKACFILTRVYVNQNAVILEKIMGSVAQLDVYVKSKLFE